MMHGPGEVRLGHSSDETCEQGRTTGCGVGGAKAGTKGTRAARSTRRTQRRGSVHEAMDRVRPAAGPLPRIAVQHPEGGAVCPNRARTDLCRGRPAMGVPTAILGPNSDISAHPTKQDRL